MIRGVVMSLVLAGALLCARPAHSHHSNVAYEVTKVITVTGVVKDFQWVNPSARGCTWLLAIEEGPERWSGRPWLSSPSVLLRAGWTRARSRSGETVTVDMSPAKNGTFTAIIARVTKADGTILSNQPAPQ